MTGASLRSLVRNALAAVADGFSPDWLALESAAQSPADRADLAVLRSMARICESFRPRTRPDPDS